MSAPREPLTCHRCGVPLELPDLEEHAIFAWGVRQGTLITCLCGECRGLVHPLVYGVFVPGDVPA